MKSLLPLLLVLFGFAFYAHAGQSFLYPMIGPMQIPCCGPANYSIDVKNVNPTFAIQNINGTFVVYRQSKVIFEETIYPRQPHLPPNQTVNFAIEVPMELLLLDGLLEIYFEFGSDFDLNPDPTQSNIAEVLGCGMTQQEVTDFFLEGFFASAEEQDAYLFLYQQLLKPGTVIRSSYLDSYSTTIGAFSWLALIYDPLKRFAQPMQVILADANTGETEVIDANFPPIIFDEPYVPEINSPDRISGEERPDQPPPAPFSFNPVASIPMDSVCAIIVTGIDMYKPYMQEGFDNDAILFRDYLSRHPYGPRIPASSILTREVKNGYKKDSLIMDLQKLKDKYKKVFFFYSGHGSSDGELMLGIEEADLFSAQDFANELLNSGAESYCVMLDACHSGYFIEPLCNHPEAQNADIEVITSSSKNNTSSIEQWHINGMNETFGKFTNHFFFAIQEPGNDKNRDGIVSLIEGYNRVTMVNLNNIVNLQLPWYKDMKSRTVKKIGERIKAAALQQYGPQVESATITVIPDVQPDGTVIESFDQSETITTTEPGYIGMIDMEPNALFSKPVTNATLIESTQVIELQDWITTWPTMPACPINPWDPAYIYQKGIDFRTGTFFNSIHQQTQTHGTPKFNRKAIIIPGWHPDSVTQKSLTKSAEAFKDNLIMEEHGLKFHEDDISFQPYIAGTTLESYLASLQGIDTLIFYYTGNMMANGDIMLDTTPNGWMNLAALFTHLVNTGASTYQLFFDASHAGMALDIIKQYNPFEGKHLDLFTGANTDRYAFFDVWVDDQLNITGAQTTTTYHFLHAYGNPSYDTDGYQGVSMKEAFNGLFIQNPIAHQNTPLFQLSQPVNYSLRQLEADASTPGTYDFPGLDLQVRFEPRSQPFAVSAAQELRTEDQVIAHADIFAISPSRRWTLTGTWDVDPSLQADLIFGYDPEIDLLNDTAGVIGLVSRLSSGDAWEPYYPIQYDEDAQTITAKQVPGPRQWAIARVQEPVGLSTHRGLTNINVYPNPVHDEINVAIELEQAMNVIVRILDITGQMHYSTRESFTQGRQVHTVRMNELVDGMYCLEVVGDHGTTNKLFVIR